METTGQLGDNIQIVEFEKIFTNMVEIKEISKLQEKLVIAEGQCPGQVPLWKSLGYYYNNSDPDLLYNRSDAVGQFLKIFPDFNYIESYIPRSHIRGNIIKINKCFQIEDRYMFLTTNGYVFTVDKEDFENYGYMASSLALLKKQINTKNSNISCSVKNGKVEYSYCGNEEGSLSGTCFVVVDSNTNQQQIYVGNKSYIYKSQLSTAKDPVTKSTIVSHSDNDAIDLGLGEIKKIALDPNQNFIFVVSEDDEGNCSLHILDHKKLFAEGSPVVDEIKMIEGVSDVQIFMDGDLVLHRTDGKTDFLNTNINSLDGTGCGFKMKQMVVNKATNKTIKDVLDSLGGGAISLDENEVSNEGNKEDLKIIEWVWNKEIEIGGVNKTLKELFNSATTEKDIENVKKGFLAIIKSNDQLNKVGELLKTIEDKINEKKNRIIFENVFSDLGYISENLSKNPDIDSLMMLREDLKLIKRKRRSIRIGNIDENTIKKDKELDELIKLVDLKIKEYQENHKEEYEEKINQGLEKIKEILNDIMNLIDVSSIYSNPEYERVKKMIDNLAPETKDSYEKKLKGVINNRRTELKLESERSKKEQLNKIEKMKKDIEEDIEQVKETIDDIEIIDAVEQFKETDPFVLRIRENFSELPSAEAQKLDLKLDRIFSERIFKLRLGGEETKGVIRNLDSYGVDTILYYNEDGNEKIEWKLEGKENPNGTIGVIIKLMNGETHEYNKGAYLKDAEKFDEVLIGEDVPKFDMTMQEFRKLNNRIKRWRNGGKDELNELSKKLQAETDPVIKEKLKKEFDDKKEYFKEARYTEALIIRIIKQQKLNPRSKVPPYDPYYIVLDEEKEILQTLSARLVDQRENSGIEILEGGPGLGKTVMCEFLANITNREMIRVQCSKMDPNDMFFAPTYKKNETTREPADWIKLMQKPGTIILFDEIDKLNDQCFERLHSLFDRSKSVYCPQDDIGTVKANPDCLFLGTRNSYDRLSNPILSRGRILQINYPGELNESYKISKYSTSTVLRKMSYEEFEMLYDKYITRGEPAPTSAQERKIYDLIINIKHMLNVFNKLRESYLSDEPFIYELSYRDARQIFVDYNSTGDFKKALELLLLPKARGAVVDSDEKSEQEKMVKDVIDEEMGI